VQAARALGVPDKRITTIATPGAPEMLARLIAAGRLRVPIAASFPVERIRTAAELQAGRHVKGKVVIEL
jgi:NADPH:quinone reductase-like Zn-dependent oxidoreductase